MDTYYRKFTALFPKKYKKVLRPKIFASYLRDFFIVSFVLMSLFQLQVLVFLNGIYKNNVLRYESYVKEYTYWESVSGQFPNIPDILYNTSLSAFNAGHKSEAIKYIERALLIDPLFEKATALRKEIAQG